MLPVSDGQSLSTSVAGSRNVASSLHNGKERAGTHPSPMVPPSLPAGAVPDSAAASYYGSDREEITRLLIQALSDLGYTAAAESVMETSGYALESPSVSAFRQAVLDGDWSTAERLLLCATTAPAFPADSSSGMNARAESSLFSSSNGNGSHGNGNSNGTASSSSSAAGLVLTPGADRNLMLFTIRQQKYLELLEQRQTAKALLVLRTELASLYQDAQKLHILPSLLMCQSPEELRHLADWDGADGQSRQQLLSGLSRFISPSVMLPEHRLAVLLGQIRRMQVSSCVYHTSASSPSLYADHRCDKSQFPSHVLRELDSHSGEVWQVRFSHDGKRLASCGSGEYVVIWDVPSFKMLLKLNGHKRGVGDIAWSPDDSLLVSCGRDGRARSWGTQDGLLKHLFDQFDEPISCCAWAADGQSIVIGSFDKDRALCQWSLDGKRLHTWTRKHRTEDLALSADGRWLVAMDDEKRLHVYNFATREQAYEVELPGRALSVAISQDSASVLVNLQSGEIIMYNILARGSPYRKYTGAVGGGFVIRCGFGGADESFVASGSEDGKLNIWHKNLGSHLFKLEAHRPRCNAVAWSPTDPCLLATCGDDHKIKIWSNSDRVRQQGLDAAASANGVGAHSSNGW